MEIRTKMASLKFLMLILQKAILRRFQLPQVEEKCENDFPMK